MITLVIDASTYRGSVAVFEGARLAAASEVAMRGRDSEALMPAVAAVLEVAEMDRRSIGRIVCGEGPGSFTSLRIAASIAKGLAVGLGRPLFAVSSLGLIAGNPSLGAGRYLATLDAMREEVYAAPFDRDERGLVVRSGPTVRIPLADRQAFAESLGAAPLDGDAMETSPLAGNAVGLLGGIEAVDVDRWEPDYGRLAEAQVKWEAANGPLPR